jgi:UDP-N-acetylmuramoylalanine--D-glutamate ligase
MIKEYLNKKVAVLGYGIEGRDAIKFLIDNGAEVTLFDKKNEEELDFAGIGKSAVKIVSGPDYLSRGLTDFDFIVRSPGVYRFIPEIIEAEKAGVKIISAIKIFFEECRGKLIGVTGTKGKGTTSTLIYEILKADGRDVYLSGNIGTPYLELLPSITHATFVVMEISSFQLIDMDASPHIAVVLNITEDHMDWHKSREEYANAKKNIVSHQKPEDLALLNEEYETPKSFAETTKGRVVFFSKQKLEEKYKEGLLLRGEHNLENIAAAIQAAKVVGINEDTILKTVRSFKGLEHRLELVGEVNGRTFYNDSFATGPQPTIAAINSFTEPETLILGGSDKGLDFQDLRDEIEKRENVKNLILIGAIGGKVGEGIVNKNIVNLGHTTIQEIVNKAYEITPKGGVVILSPAAASFDMFKNYKDRGNQFKNAVRQLNEKET